MPSSVASRSIPAMWRGRRQFLSKTLGPGLLFAGAAVGVSHLVQSTRAGASFGLAMLLVLIGANIIKYPAFSFGPRYAAATGTSLLEGYRRRGRLALVVYALLTLGTMFTVQAAVTIVTAAIGGVLFDLDAPLLLLSTALMAVCIVILAVGHYRWLDSLVKVVVATLTLLTVTATAPGVARHQLGRAPTSSQRVINGAGCSLLPSLAGCPSAIDVSIWHSLWTIAKRRDTGYRPTVNESLLDFKIGYFGTAFLAVCFLLLGAALVYGTGEAMPKSGGGFANKVISLYVASLGEWSRYVIGTCAFLVMFSTTLTVIDGFPRALSALLERFTSAEDPDEEQRSPRERERYWIFVSVMLAGSVITLQISVQHFTRLIDVATTISCLTAPVLAFLNHKAVTGAEVPEEHRPGTRMRIFSLVCIALLGGLAIAWLYARFV